MVKTKKSKKEIAAADEIEIDSDSRQTKLSDDEKIGKNKKGKNAKKISSKKQSSDDEGEVEKLAESVSKLKVKSGKSGPKLSDNNTSESEEEQPKKKGRSQPAKKAGFDLLIGDDDDDGNEIQTRPEPETDSDVEKEIKKGKSTLKDDLKGKKGKKARRKKDEDDEDLDKVLAELEAEYSGVKVEQSVLTPQDNIEDESSKKKKGKKAGKNEIDSVSAKDEINSEIKEENDENSTVKTAAQKKKEKKERQKREAALAKQKVAEVKSDQIQETSEDIQEKPEKQPKQKVRHESETKEPSEEIVKMAENEEDMADDDKKGDKKSKKDKKKEKGKKDKEEEKKDDKKKGVSKAMVAAMQERLKKIKEDEERLQKEEEERIRQAEERERQRLEAIRLEQERKEKRKQKEQERKARLKAEGKLLTKKQKEDRAKAQAMLEALKAQGLDVPDPAEKRPRPGTRIRPNKKKMGKQEGQTEGEQDKSGEGSKDSTPVPEDVSKKGDEVKEAWDASSSDEENNTTPETTSDKKPSKETLGNKQEQESEEESSEGSMGSEVSDEDEDNESVGENDEGRSDDQAKRERAMTRIEKRREESEKKRNLENLRAAVVCVLGHVDTGKTKILDKLRRTHVQDSEAGGITQQIGATNVPIEAIKEQTKIVKGSSELQHKLPGLLIIDTPGHESFSNLRNRGSSLCDIAILVVDIMHGLEPQTIESINLLKQKKCPFIVALNKIDRLYDWQTMPRKDIRDIIKGQQSNTQLEFNQRSKEVIVQFAEQGLNAALFYENPDPRTYISLVPTSAITGEGMGNLLYLIVDFCQTMLAKRLMYSEDLQATILEVKAIPGLGTTIDAILINGKLREGETMILAGTDGPIVTQIRSLLMPQPLKELRVKNAYQEYKEIKAAQGVKIAAKDLEKAIAGINLLIAHKPDEVEICKDEVARELKHALSHIKLKERGVYVQASTLGSLEALLEFLKSSNIPYSAIRIGPVVKRDVMKASIMLEHEPQYATILAFDVKVERDAQELADSLGVKIFQADIIYHLFDKFMAYREELKKRKREEFRSIAVFPCKLKILPQFIFNSRDPIVMGVMVENGIVKEGTPICVPSKDFVDIGVVTSIESNHKQVESARKGQEVCIKIEPIPGESPKMFGRHFEADDMLVSKISRQSIDACKDYFRDDLLKSDWALMVELKKVFEIL
ncbi:eukaryotic translation initiation factor 5B [Condylostylus longicornis]|uniref:eukaryotic translation initiation factor 5B n=1 Tax=Condylostylus longicornis TaxID=2530218 RepID=UPI00244E417C|nr:eukaryotic translation initiation factor 5B [Condylostylus longicornis]